MNATPEGRGTEPGLAPGGDLPPLLRWLGGLDERRALALFLGASLLLTLAAALSSDSVFQVDEYFQVIEFTSHKLGVTPGGALPWEFAARMRGWTQPGLYYLLARGAMAAGIHDPFALTRAFRVASGLVAWSALVAIVLATRAWFPARPWRPAVACSLALAYHAPYLAARTSSESGATSFLLLGLALLVGPGAGGGLAARAPARRLLAAGAALGLAFECPYQVGLAIAGLMLWLLLRGRERWRTFALTGAGLAAVLALGVLVDAWGYGGFALVPWNYLRVNVFEDRAAGFGTMPPYAYAGILLLTFPPFGAALLAGLLLLWWRRPGHLLTWLTAPFVIGHSLIGHKEFRFLFPMLAPAALGLLLLWSGPEARAGRGAALLRRLRALWFSRAVWALDLAAVLLLCLLPSSDNFGLQRYFREHGYAGRWVGFTDPLRAHGIETPFLWPRPLPPVAVVRSVAELARAADASPVPLLVAAKYPLPDGAADFLARRAERVFVSLPPFVARLNLFHWVDRADLTYVYRIPPALPGKTAGAPGKGRAPPRAATRRRPPGRRGPRAPAPAAPRR